jgi:hypothetical protein
VCGDYRQANDQLQKSCPSTANGTDELARLPGYLLYWITNRFSMYIRESEAQCPALSQHAVEAGQARHGKRISKKAQLKNCCLGGLRARQRKKRREKKSQFFLTERILE